MTVVRLIDERVLANDPKWERALLAVDALELTLQRLRGIRWGRR